MPDSLPLPRAISEGQSQLRSSPWMWLKLLLRYTSYANERILKKPKLHLENFAKFSISFRISFKLLTKVQRVLNDLASSPFWPYSLLAPQCMKFVHWVCMWGVSLSPAYAIS